MLIGFTGSQNGMTNFQKDQVEYILKLKGCTEFVHGDCIGSDEQAMKIAAKSGVSLFTIHPPDNLKKRAFCADPERKLKWNKLITPYMDVLFDNGPIKVRWFPVNAYLARNRTIVDQVELVIACPKEFQHTVRSGTWSTIRYAWKTKKDKVVVIPPIERPDGSINENEDRPSE